MIVTLVVWLFELIRALLWVYNLLVVVYTVLSLVRIPANKWTELLSSIVEPGLAIARKLMKRFLPALCKPGIDWSPAVLFVSIIVVRFLIGWLL